ncbi:MAG: Rrf2 family transcriptional regulator [Candidatus Omnitrophica bacterium]|nr:Rrf2 family transcriptional regulator [Candidatus Omnitrophota bacterium]MDD5574224.1 Rrf2 family transcriptional regulator [Candidatus Omnitrophota bacterium]
MRITTQGDYALKCILRIAADGPQGPVSISRIVDKEGLPLDYLEQLLLKLRRSRLIKSVRGARGGYLLNVPVASITVAHVLRAAEGEIFELICDRKKKDGKKCKGSEDCVLKDVWKNLKNKIETYLGSVKLKDLLKKTRCTVT